MADNIDRELDSLDDLDFDINFEEELKDNPNVSDIVKKELISIERLKKVGDRLTDNIPNEITNKLSVVSKPVEGLKEVLDEQINPLRDNATNLLESLEKTVGDDNIAGKILKTIKNVIKRDKPDEKTESDEEKVKRLLEQELSNIKSIETANKITQLASTYDNYTQKKLLGNILATIKVMSQAQLDTYKEYSKTHLKIEIKQLIALESMNKLLLTNVPVMLKYMSNIVKNTGLPDVAKLKTSEYFKHMFANKVLEGGLSFLNNNAYITNIKNALKEKASTYLSNLGNALGMGNMLVESMIMSKEMGISPLETLISTIADVGTNKIVDKIGKNLIETGLRTGLGRESVDEINKYTSDIHYGASDIAEKLREKDTLFSNALSRVLEFISEASGSNKANNITLQHHKPTDPAIFDYQTRSAIVTVIPTYLSKIYAELVGIRTGKRPESELVYDYYKNKFVTTTELRREVQKTIIDNTKKLTESLNDKRLFGLIESRVKLTPEERKKLKEAYIKHIMSGGTSSPYYLERDGFFDLLPKTLSNKVKQGLEEGLKSKTLRDIKLKEDLQKALSELSEYGNTAGIGLAQVSEKISNLGRTDVLESLGLLDSKDHTILKSENIADLYGKVSKKYTTGEVHLDTHGLSYKDYVKALAARKEIIDKITKLQDNRVSSIDKEAAIKLLDTIPYKDYVDINNRLKTDVNVYLFIKDLLNKNKDVERDVKSFKDKLKEAIKTHTPEQIKSMEKKFKEDLNNRLSEFKEKLKTKLDIEDKLDESKVYENIWDKDSLEGNVDNKVFNPEYIGLKHKRIKQFTEYDNYYTGMRAAHIAIPNMEFSFVKDIVKAISNNTTSIVNSIKTGIENLIDNCCANKEFSKTSNKEIINKTEQKTTQTFTPSILSTIPAYKVKQEQAKDITESKPVKNTTKNKINKESTVKNKPNEENDTKSVKSFASRLREKIDRAFLEDTVTDNKTNANKKNEFKEDKVPLNPHMRKAFINIFGDSNKKPNKEDVDNKESSNTDNDNIISRITKNIKDKAESIYKNVKDEYKTMHEHIEYELAMQRLRNGGETDYERFKDKLKSKLGDLFRGINLSSITREYKDISDKYSGDFDNVKKEIDDEYKHLKKEGLLKVLSGLLSKFPLPEPEEAEVFYRKEVSKIDPLGVFSKVFSSTKDFVTTMYTIHFKSLEGRSIDVNDLEELGVHINENELPHAVKALLWGEADQGYYNPTNYIEQAIPKPLRNMFESYGITNLLANTAGRVIRAGFRFPKIMLGNLGVIKDTAKETFFDDSGRLRVNLLRLGKFLGKSYVNTALYTGKEMRGIYSDIFGGIGDVAGYGMELLGKYGLGLGRLNKGVIGTIASKIPGLKKIDEKLLVRKAPLPYEVKAAYLRGTIKFKDIPFALGDEQRDVYLNWLMEEEKSMPKASPLRKIITDSIKWYFKTAQKLGETSQPVYSKIGKTSVKAGIKLSKFTFKALGSDDIRDMLFKTTRNVSEATKDVGEHVSPIYKEVLKDISKIPSILSKIIGVDELKSKDKDKKKESTTGKILDKLTSILNKKNKKNPFDKNNDGIRDGSYVERLKEFEKEDKEAEKASKDIHKTIKDKTSSSDNTLLWTLITGGVSLLVSKLKSLFGKGFMSGLGKVFESVIWKPIKWLGKTILHGIGDFLSGLIKHIPGLKTVTSVIDKVKDKVTHIVGNVKNTVTNIVEHPKSMISNVFSWIKSKAVSGYELIKNSLGFIKDKLVEGTVYLTEHAKSFIAKLTPTRLKALVSKLKVSEIKKAIKTIVRKLATKLGVKESEKIGAKLLSRLIPGIGTVILGIDAATVAYYYFIKHWSLVRSIAYGLLGIDIGDDEDNVKHIPNNKITNNESNLTSIVPNNINKTTTDFFKYHRDTLTKDQEANIYKELNSVMSKFTTKTTGSKGTIAKFNLDHLNISLARLVHDLKEDEGVSLSVYRDNEGNKTIGVGHLLEPSKGGIPLRNIIGVDKNTITENEADYILLYDISRISKQLFSRLPWLKDQPEVIVRNLINMAFNLGVNGLLSFTQTLKYIKEAKYREAALELTKSKWYKETGVRAKRIVNEIFHATGRYVSKDITTKVSSHTHLLLSKPNDKHIDKTLSKMKLPSTKINTELANIHNSKIISNNQAYSINLQAETNHILKESLKIQASMLQYLKGIYDLTKLVYTNGIPTRIDATKEQVREVEHDIDNIENKIGDNRKQIIDDISKPVFSVSTERF